MKGMIGIDEVGRGPIAGPVAVGVFLLKEKISFSRFTIPLRDSKKLTSVQRERWYAHIRGLQKEGKCDFAVTMISAKTIDIIGIAPSIKKALVKSLSKIEAQNTYTILLDGGLTAPKEFKKQKTIIKGDEKEPTIALASIVAKVTRDRHMQKMAKKYPQYGFETHVGYGTRAHYTAIRKFGATPIHRSSFLRNLS